MCLFGSGPGRRQFRTAHVRGRPKRPKIRPFARSVMSESPVTAPRALRMRDRKEGRGRPRNGGPYRSGRAARGRCAHSWRAPGTNAQGMREPCGATAGPGSDARRIHAGVPWHASCSWPAREVYVRGAIGADHGNRNDDAMGRGDRPPAPRGLGPRRTTAGEPACPPGGSSAGSRRRPPGASRAGSALRHMCRPHRGRLGPGSRAVRLEFGHRLDCPTPLIEVTSRAHTA